MTVNHLVIGSNPIWGVLDPSFKSYVIIKFSLKNKI
jgi:hypothetical protein